MGDLAAAEEAFGRLEATLASAETDAGARANRGLLAMGHGEYERASTEFDAALALEPNCCVAVNNRAVCELHLSHIGLAIAGLEDFVRADPVGHLDPTLVANLAAMYELHSDSAAAMRRTLERLVALVGADDFDVQLQPRASATVALPAA